MNDSVLWIEPNLARATYKKGMLNSNDYHSLISIGSLEVEEKERNRSDDADLNAMPNKLSSDAESGNIYASYSQDHTFPLGWITQFTASISPTQPEV